jgi:lambda family phage portal protein
MAEDLRAEVVPIQRARAEAQSAALTLAKRYYDGAARGRRTEGWRRSGGDSASTTRGQGRILRDVARDLVRNNAWARNAHRVITNNIVGWGIRPRGLMPDAATAWAQWSESNRCSLDGRANFAGIQRLAVQAMVQDGECLIVRHMVEGSAVPLALEVLEADHLDTAKDYWSGTGNQIRQGIEFDSRRRPVAYWLFPDHPGGTDAMRRDSVRVPAEDVIHLFRVERPGQIRGVSWLAPAIVKLHDFDDYHDALLVRQKIAACFSAFVRDMDGSSSAIGEVDDTGFIETLEPGRIDYLKPGQDITFATPPGVPESEGRFSMLCLRSIASAMGVTYEDLTGDFSQVNYSSARMGRLAHWASVADWQHNTVIPQLCVRVWEWFEPIGRLAGLYGDAGTPEWTPPSMPMTDPEKEGAAYQLLIRAGAMTHDELAATMGRDPAAHWREYASGLARLDALGISLDSDPRRMTAQGQVQQTGAENPGKVAES